jgi:transcriptional regulator with XRE-family HTH domain
VPDTDQEGEDAKRLLELRQHVAANLTRFRRKNGKTQSEVAAALGCESTYVQRIEYGKATPSLRFLVKLAGLLDVELCDLVKSAPAVQQRKRGRPRGKRPKSTRA